MSLHIIRTMRLTHCKRGPERCEKCREMNQEKICLLDIEPPDQGMVQRRVIKLQLEGEEAWRERSFGRSHMVLAGGKMVIVDEDGQVAVATPTKQGLQVHARADVLKKNAWTPPTLVGRRLYVRDRSDILALDLGG